MINSVDKYTNFSLPIGWQLRSLGEVTTSSQYGISSSSGRDCSVPILKMNNLQDGHIDLSNLDYIELSRAEMETLLLNKGDLLINRTNSYDLVGKSAIYEMDGEHVFASYLVRFRLSQSVLPTFVNYYLNSVDGQRKLKRLATKAVSQANINPSTLKKQLLIPLPPLPEQRRIAEILSTWDRAIDLTAQLIAAKQQYKRGLMQQLLTGKRKFRAFQKKEWASTSFGQIFYTKSAKNIGSQIKNPITVGKYAIRPQNEHFNRIVASDNLENYNIIEQDDFVYDPMSAYYGAFGRYELDEAGIVSPVYRVLHINPNHDSDFMKHFIKSHYIAYQLSANSSQGNREGKRRTIQTEAFDSISFKIPDIDEQRAIAEVLNACDHELSLLNHKLELLKKQKQGLMQQLLTGKVRVKT